MVLVTPFAADCGIRICNDPGDGDGDGTSNSNQFELIPIKQAIIVIPGVFASQLYEKDDDERIHSVWPLDPSRIGLEITLENILSLYFDKEKLAKAFDGLDDLNLLESDNPMIFDYRNTYGAYNTYFPILDYLYRRLSTDISNTEDSLHNNQVDVIFFPYDWRQSNLYSALKLQEYLRSNFYGNVVLVGHSLGGLVAAKFLAMDKHNREIASEFESLATPLLGTPITNYLLETGDLQQILPTIKDSIEFYSTPFIGYQIRLLLRDCFIRRYPSVYEAMPNDQYISMDPFISLNVVNYDANPEWGVETYIIELSSVQINEYYTHLYGSYYLNAKQFQNSLYNDLGVFVTEFENVNTKYYIGTYNSQNLTVSQITYITEIYGNVPYWNLEYNSYFLYQKNLFPKNLDYRRGDDVVTYLSASLGYTKYNPNVYIFTNIEHFGFISEENFNDIKYDEYNHLDYKELLYNNIKEALVE